MVSMLTELEMGVSNLTELATVSKLGELDMVLVVNGRYDQYDKVLNNKFAKTLGCGSGKSTRDLL